MKMSPTYQQHLERGRNLLNEGKHRAALRVFMQAEEALKDWAVRRYAKTERSVLKTLQHRALRGVSQ